jgi:hypothetical protein
MVEGPIPISTQHNLVDLDLSNNNLSGRIPKWLFTKRSTLVNLNLGSNSLTGHLDPIWYPQISLRSIDISINHIVGQLPDNISSIFPSLTDIDVSNNNFSREIPVSFCRIHHIRNLHLHNNMFSGEMPACMLKDRRGDQRGGEWEPIKISHGIWPISQNQPKSTSRKIQRCLNLG